MEYVIESVNLVKQFKSKLAVNQVSIHVKRGDIYGLIGKNGAGKTSLMKLILGLITPTKGCIKLFGKERINEARKKIGSLIESPGLYKNCTAYENMLRFAILYGADKKEIKPILDKVGLGNTGLKKAGDFSLGMRQRLGIAIALLSKPEILILDEPINGLDPAGIKEIRDIILSLHAEGVTFIISSHLLDELAKVVTNYGIIADGRLVEEIEAKDLEKRCSHYIKIVGDNLIQIQRLLLEKYTDMKTEIKEDGLYISNYLDKSSEMNTYLIQKSLSISELRLSSNGFEEFFIERLGR